MTAKEYLEQIPYYESLIARKKEELEELETKLRYQSPRFDSQGIHSTSKDNKMDYGTNKLIELREEIKKTIDEYEHKRDEIINQINKIRDGKLSEVLYLRYVKMLKVTAVAKKMKIGERTVKRLTSDALKVLVVKE